MQIEAHSTRAKEGLGWGLLVLWVVVTTLGWAVYWGQDSWMPGSDPKYVDEMLYTVKQAYGMGTDDLVELETAVAGVVSGLLFSGPILGIGQALILLSSRRTSGTKGTRGKDIRSWLIATWVGLLLGWGLGGCVSLSAVTQSGTATGVLEAQVDQFNSAVVVNGAAIAALIISGTIITAVVGGILGFCQWRVLRRWVRDAGWWIIASLLGWAAGGAVYWSVYRIMGGTLQGVGEPWPGREVYVRASVAGYVAGGIVVGVVTGLTLKLLLDRANKEVSPTPETAKETTIP